MMEFHPYASIFPLIQGAEFQAFCENFRTHGFQPNNEIVLFEGKILDGRNRFRACEATDTQPEYRQFDAATEGDPLDYVLTTNLHRRHLNESQRAMVAAEMVGMRKGGGQPGNRNASKTTLPIGNVVSMPVTLDMAAKALNVGSGTLGRARKVKARGSQELKDAVVAGEIALGSAERIAELPAEKQKEVLRKSKTDRTAVAKAVRPTDSRGKGHLPKAVQDMVAAIERLKKVIDKGLMRISIVELSEVHQSLDNAAKTLCSRYRK